MSTTTYYWGTGRRKTSVARVRLARGEGRIVAFGSIAGVALVPKMGAYCATKSAVNTYLQGVRSRLWRAGVQVHILKPGPVDTPMTVDHDKNMFFATPDQIADGIVRAIDTGRHVAWLPGFWAVIMPVVRALPEPIFQRLPFLSGR